MPLVMLNIHIHGYIRSTPHCPNGSVLCSIW